MGPLTVLGGFRNQGDSWRGTLEFVCQGSVTLEDVPVSVRDGWDVVLVVTVGQGGLRGFAAAVCGKAHSG